MKIILLLLTTLFTISIISFAVLGIMSKSGKAPGLTNGKLSQCSKKPNCVCSEYSIINTDKPSHFIKPIIIPKQASHDLLPIIKAIIKTMNGTIQTENEFYIATTFSSAIFGFVDDFEIRIEQDKNTLHLRSASRVGYGDRGVNKKRTLLFKKLFSEKISNQTLVKQQVN